MHSARWPHLHGMNHEVPNVRHRSIVHHVVMLIHVQDMGRRTQHSTSNHRPPPLKSRMVFLNHERNRAIGPFQELPEPFCGRRDLIEVVEIDVEDRASIASG
jgi:hypothetical protein